jgi:hypothetical protein
MNKLVDINDTIDFGSLKGEHFFWIYRMKVDYLVWLIENTTLCFSSLTDFYRFGKPKYLKEKVMQSKIELILGETFNNPPMEKLSNHIFITIENYNRLIVNNHFKEDDFQEVDFSFSDYHIKLNAEKLMNSEPFSNLNLKNNRIFSHNFFYKNESK